MVDIIVHGQDGAVKHVEGDEGYSLMEVLREAGYEEIQAICGGCRSCGTCHVYIDPAFIGALPAPCEEELMVLEGAVEQTAESRLACQIPVTPELEGMNVTIPPQY